MSYNRFQWWRSALKTYKRPLNSKHYTLLARMRHGDFDYPITYLSAISDVEDEIENIKQTLTETYSGRSTESLNQDIRDATRMKNVRRLKLQDEMHQRESKLLNQLRYELRTEFGIDLWTDLENGKYPHLVTVEDLYALYEQEAHQKTCT